MGLGGRGNRLAIAGVVALGVLLRVGLVLTVDAADPDRAVVADTRGYVEPAQSLLHDGHFDRARGSSVPEFQRTPGYPVFVAAVYWASGESDTAVVLVQAVAGGLTVLLVILLARRLSGSLALALVAGVLVALDPVGMAQAGLVATETVATALVTLTAYCGVRFAQSSGSPRWGAAYGLALVAATYVRPTTYYFVLVAAALLAVAAVRRARPSRAGLVRGAVAVVVPCFVLLGAWNLRNHHEVDSWRFSAIESTNLYWYRAAAVRAERDDAGIYETQVQLTRELSEGLVPAFDYEDYRSGRPPRAWEHRQGAYYGRANRAAFRILLSEPWLSSRQVVRGVYGQVVQSGWVTAFEYLTGDSPPGVVRGAGLVVVWAIEGLALLGAYVTLRRRSLERLGHVLTVALVAYSVMAVAVGPDAAGGYRFRIPIWPIICAYAAIGLAACWRKRHLVPGRP